MNTLREVREARGGKAVDEIYDALRDEGINLKARKCGSARQLTRLEQYPVEKVDRVIVAGFLAEMGTTIEDEFPDLAESMRPEVTLLAKALEHAARTGGYPLAPIDLRERQRPIVVTALASHDPNNAPLPLLECA